jgi:hypothetical protein
MISDVALVDFVNVPLMGEEEEESVVREVGDVNAGVLSFCMR